MKLLFALALLTAALAPAAHPASAPPTPAEVAEARASLERRAAERRAAIDRAVALWLLNSGYFQMITDAGETAEIVAVMQRRLQGLGIEAVVGDCDWMGLLAQGTAHGNRSYAAACKVRVGREPERYFLICHSDLGGISLVAPDMFASSADYVEVFMRRACF